MCNEYCKTWHFPVLNIRGFNLSVILLSLNLVDFEVFSNIMVYWGKHINSLCFYLCWQRNLLNKMQEKSHNDFTVISNLGAKLRRDDLKRNHKKMKSSWHGLHLPDLWGHRVSLHFRRGIWLRHYHDGVIIFFFFSFYCIFIVGPRRIKMMQWLFYFESWN